MYPERSTNKILSWAEEDRPREKLLLKGKSALSNSELIAIVIGSGNRTQTAVDLASEILQKNDNSINKLALLDVKALMKYKGIGEAKAISIVSALELGRRRLSEEQPEKIKITSSNIAYNLMKSNLLDLKVEEFWIILLNRANVVIKKTLISTGGVSGTLVDAKIIFYKALEELASAVILVHNHPSGNLQPSQADKTLTSKIKKAGEVLEIQVLDHIIFTNEGYYSFADEQIL